MILRQLVHRDHEHVCSASYLVADEGEALVVDPAWDIQPYLDLCQSNRLRILHVVDTHLHSDHVSGARRLARTTGADHWNPAGAHGRTLSPHSRLTLGGLTVVALPAPGHRPEHLALAVYDGESADDLRALLTGHSLAVEGAVPPDVGVDDSAGLVELAGTIERIAALPDGVEIWPGHVAGPLGALGLFGDKDCSTVGGERRHNPYLDRPDPAHLATLFAVRTWPRPPLAEHVLELNRTVAVDDAEPAVLTAVDAERAVRSGAIVIDGRSPDRFDGGHVPGSLNVPLQGRAVGTRAAAMLGADLELVLVADAYRDAVVLAGLLVSAGLTRIVGTLAGGIAQRRSVPLPVDRVSAADIETARNELDAGLATVLDVREAEEVYADPLPGALCVPLADVPFLRRRDLPQGPILVACQTGNRAALAASVLRRNGVGHVRRVAGGGVPELKAVLPVSG